MWRSLLEWWLFTYSMLKAIIFSAFIFALMVILGFIFHRPEIRPPGKVRELLVGTVTFKAEIADTITARTRGLSYREKLADDQAMLFVFPIAGNYSFWMRGMKFPLDIIWITEDKIIGIEKNVPTPKRFELSVYAPPELVDKVLEINAGLSDKLGLRVGDAIVLK